MNVLVYSGLDAAPTPLAHTFASLRALLTPNYAVQPVDQKVLQTQPWTSSCGLLVLPPFTPSAASTSFAPATRAEIQKYLAGDGKLLALGAGVRVAARRGQGASGMSALSAHPSTIDVSAPEVEVSPAGEKLTLEDGDEDGIMLSLVLSSRSEQEADAEATSIRLDHGSQLEGVLRAGVVDISQAEAPSWRIEPIAHCTSRDTLLAARSYQGVGRSGAASWSAHIETPIASDLAQEKVRLHATLEGLGLQLPENVSQELGTALRPTPQVLTGALAWCAGAINAIIRALQVNLASPAPYRFKDRHDTFLCERHLCGGGTSRGGGGRGLGRENACGRGVW